MFFDVVSVVPHSHRSTIPVLYWVQEVYRHHLLRLRDLHQHGGGDATLFPPSILSAVAEAFSGTKRQRETTLLIRRNFFQPRLVLLGAALCMVYFGFINFVEGFPRLFQHAPSLR